MTSAASLPTDLDALNMPKDFPLSADHKERLIRENREKQRTTNVLPEITVLDLKATLACRVA